MCHVILVLPVVMAQSCFLLRFECRNTCVVRLEETGAILRIHLAKPLDVSRACMISPFEPAKGRVELGKYENNMHTECVLDVDWPTMRYPEPARFKRKRTARNS